MINTATRRGLFRIPNWEAGYLTSVNNHFSRPNYIWFESRKCKFYWFEAQKIKTYMTFEK